MVKLCFFAKHRLLRSLDEFVIRSGNAVVEGTVRVRLTVECQRCAIKSETDSVITYPSNNLTATFLNYNPSCDCEEKYFDEFMDESKETIESGLQAKIFNELSSLDDVDKRSTCGCVVVCPPGSYLNGSFDTYLSANLHIKQEHNQLIVQSTNTTAIIPASNNNLSVCPHTGNFYGQSAFVENTIKNETQTNIQQILKNETQSFNIPTVIRPFPSYPIYFEYFLQQVYFTARVNITATCSAVMYAINPSNQSDYITFIDYDEAETTVLPPLEEWLVKNNTVSSTTQQPMDAFRLATTALSGAADLADKLGLFRDGADTQILDANLRFNMSFVKPVFSVAQNGLLQVHLPAGSLLVTCLNKQTKNRSLEYGDVCLHK